MQKWRRVIAFDVVMIVLIILLYSPFQLGLSPFDPNFVRAALSVVFAAIIGYELVKVNGRALLTARADKRLTDNSEEIPAEDVKRILGEYEKTAVVCVYAKRGLDELARSDAKRAALYDAIGSKFSEGSLTWHKFTEVVDSATQAITHNAALLARRIQTFDVEDYQRNARDTITGLFKRTEMPESLRKEKREVFEMSLNDMRGIVAANERLLLELDKFSIELDKLESDATAESNNLLLEEVTELVEETKYYR